VTARIAETRRSDAPLAVQRTIQQFYSARGELGTGSIHIFHIERQLKARAGVGLRANIRD
jgi:hypothetical protein